jgi:hypothetical protein
MSSPSDTRFAELEALVASLKTQLDEQKTQLEARLDEQKTQLEVQRLMLAEFVLPPELLRASKKGKTDMVEKLVAAGAKPEATDEVKGRTTCTCTWARCFARFQNCMTCACHALEPLPITAVICKRAGRQYEPDDSDQERERSHGRGAGCCDSKCWRPRRAGGRAKGGEGSMWMARWRGVGYFNEVQLSVTLQYSTPAEMRV